MYFLCIRYFRLFAFFSQLLFHSDAVNYAGDVHQYIDGSIVLHWHNQIELFLLEEGEMQVDVGDQHVRLRGEEGCFVNFGQSHAFYIYI